MANASTGHEDPRKISNEDDGIEFYLLSSDDNDQVPLVENEETIDLNADVQDALTYKPGLQNDTQNRGPSNAALGSSGDGAVPPGAEGSGCVNLRERVPINYSCQALPTNITTSDEPSVREELDSPERQFWVDAVKEEFKVLMDSGTYERDYQVPNDAEVIPSGIILRLQRDEDGRPKRF